MSALSVLPRGARTSDSPLTALVRETWIHIDEALVGVEDLAAVLREYGETDPVVLERAGKLCLESGAVSITMDGTDRVWEAGGELHVPWSGPGTNLPGTGVWVIGVGSSPRRAFADLIADIRRVLVPPEGDYIA